MNHLKNLYKRKLFEWINEIHFMIDNIIVEFVKFVECRNLVVIIKCDDEKEKKKREWNAYKRVH